MAELIEGVDYFVHFVRFANRANPALTVENPDGTHDIYFNTRYDMARLRAELPHELRHILDNHFHMEELPIDRIERQADGEPLDLIGAAKERGDILHFASEAALARYIKALAKQRGVDLSGLRLQDQITWGKVPEKRKERSDEV